MDWLLIVVLNTATPSVVMERFPNQESCDSIRVWFGTYADVKRSVCLPDIQEPQPEPALKELPPDTTSDQQ